MADPAPRARVVIVKSDRVALIRRLRDGHTYFLFPGGGVEEGETPEQAARREAVEELGVEVELGELVHEEAFGGTRFLYYDAWIVGGSFGTGDWPDHADLTARERARAGTYEAVWVPLRDLPGLDIRPAALAAMLTPR
jgi:ADP-ribose pyrophosphatase YjhB (NUDIX family)